MKSKSSMISDRRNNIKQLFLLSWAKFLTYDEMEATDTLDIFELYKSNHKCENAEDWKKYTITYNEDNVTKAMCVSLHIAFEDILRHGGHMTDIYVDDVNAWLRILENDRMVCDKQNMQQRDAIAFFSKICRKYGFDIDFEYLLRDTERQKNQVKGK